MKIECYSNKNEGKYERRKRNQRFSKLLKPGA